MKKTLIGSALAFGLLIGSGGVSANGTIPPLNIQGMDIETALMMVQSQRTSLLDEQLKSQIENVQQRTEDIAVLNEQIALLNQEAATANSTRQAELAQQINELKAQISTLSNSQQMDMLRLQSLNNKRNEAFDVMTDFVKKMQDSRSSIINNMR
ncbi:hypothetical protein [Metasolibacillus fluoroglycofenilyticus]|uniref:hypothetical protein n=1 Tax=Metasolibacillus fluoroglycofenilyticus TaxID=1239396 RepID=UPI000D3BB4D1|nr:hypothetical protein [Metasolibacillus fluoroglycofenilyticus]